MLFSSTIFIFLFLPSILFLYYLPFGKNRLLQNILLTLGSLLFYAWGEPKFVIIMVISIFVNWIFALIIDKYRENENLTKFILIITVVLNLGILFIFKYLMFTLNNINLLLGSKISIPEIALPIGISFFTFQAISYVVDVYRKDGEVQKNIMNVALYISFFPQLIAGPIVRYQTVANEIKNRKENFDDFANGSCRFIIGLGKKVLLSNTIAIVADKAFAINSQSELSIAMAWLGGIAYTLQIFYDFSGYSDMAIGLGEMFGFHFLENFDYPYISTSVSEFWRRWHISLGSWFRDYVYFPLGGSRVKSRRRMIFNLFAVWGLTGIWHGANWTFIIWGLMYFILISFEKLTGFEKKLTKLKPLKYIYTMIFVIIGWVIFRATNVNEALKYIGAMFGIGAKSIVDSNFIIYILDNKVFFLAAILFSSPIGRILSEKTKNIKILTPLYTIGLIMIFIFSISYIFKGAYNPFIYFNF